MINLLSKYALLVLGSLAAVVGAAMIQGCDIGNAPNDQSMAENQQTGPSKFLRPNIPPPKYRLYKQSANKGMVSVVLASNTTN